MNIQDMIDELELLAKKERRYAEDVRGTSEDYKMETHRLKARMYEQAVDSLKLVLSLPF